MKKQFKSSILVASLMVAAVCRQAEAIPLPPGGAGVPTPDVLPSSALLDTVVGAFLIPNPVQGDLLGTVTTRVYAPDPIYDPFLGGLIFTYDISLGTDAPNLHALGRISTVEWATFAADARQSAAALTDELAKTVDRATGLGDVIGFSFAPLSTFTGGDVSATLILVSDAPLYTPSKVSLINGGVDETPSFAPARQQRVPDGATTIVLLGLALGALNGARRFTLA